jgi:hypothetical protein
MATAPNRSTSTARQNHRRPNRKQGLPLRNRRKLSEQPGPSQIYNTDRSKKTYFFAANQWTRINQTSVIPGAVFPQAMRNGNFSQSPTLPSNGILTLDSHSQALLASQGKANCINGPTTLNPLCFDPVAVALLTEVPLPNNIPGGFLNYLNQNPYIARTFDNQYRVDQYIGKNNELTGRITGVRLDVE